MDNLTDRMLAYHELSKVEHWKGLHTKRKPTGEVYLKEAAVCHGSVASSVALEGGSLPKAIAPPLHHVKPFGMPDVSF